MFCFRILNLKYPAGKVFFEILYKKKAFSPNKMYLADLKHLKVYGISWLIIPSHDNINIMGHHVWLMTLFEYIKNILHYILWCFGKTQTRSKVVCIIQWNCKDTQHNNGYKKHWIFKCDGLFKIFSLCFYQWFNFIFSGCSIIIQWRRRCSQATGRKETCNFGKFRKHLSRNFPHPPNIALNFLLFNWISMTGTP